MKIPKDVGSKYRFIILAGQRVAQLQKGAKARIDGSAEKMKYTTVAIRELENDRLDIQPVGKDKDTATESEQPKADEKATAES